VIIGSLAICINLHFSSFNPRLFCVRESLWLLDFSNWYRVDSLGAL
jgi:hypothetical protein